MQAKVSSQLSPLHLVKHGPNAYNLAVRDVKSHPETVIDFRNLFDVSIQFDVLLPQAATPAPAAAVATTATAPVAAFATTAAASVAATAAAAAAAAAAATAVCGAGSGRGGHRRRDVLFWTAAAACNRAAAGGVRYDG